MLTDYILYMQIFQDSNEKNSVKYTTKFKPNLSLSLLNNKNKTTEKYFNFHGLNDLFSPNNLGLFKKVSEKAPLSSFFCVYNVKLDIASWSK